MSYQHVLSPLTIRNVTLKNRVIRTAHGTSLSMMEPSGLGPDLINYHVARAKGGVALSILELASVHTSCLSNLAMYKQGLSDSYDQLLDAVTPHDMLLLQQLWHSGNHATTLDGSPCWAPSDVPSPSHGLVPTPMTKMMIDEITEAYINGAKLAKDSGLAGIEVHSGHSYLPQQFMSPAWNRREDEYGGSLENRMRFIMDILTGIRAAVGEDFVISVRISDDELEDSLGIEENQQILRILESSGAVDIVNCSRGSYCKGEWTVGGMHYPTGYQLEKSVPILEGATSVYRSVQGRFRTLEEADQAIRLGQTDLVSMVRATIADPNLVAKTVAGRPEDVRPCIACNHCITNEMYHVPMTCAINAATGSESRIADDEIEKTNTPKKALVIGGGPAGMEAARLFALAGHNTVLVEANKDLGGQINYAKKAPFRLTIGDVTDWQEKQLRKLGVEIRLNTYFTEDDVLNEKADAVVVATGSLPRMDGVFVDDPSVAVEGVNLPFVQSSHDLLGASSSKIDGKVVVVDDVGHYEGLGVAEYALAKGAEEVIFVTRHANAGFLMDYYITGVPARKRLYETGRFRLLPEAKLRSIAANRTVSIDTCLGTQSESVTVEQVILVSANLCNREIFDTLNSSENNIRVVGDANSPRFLNVAIREGNVAARELVASLSQAEQ